MSYAVWFGEYTIQFDGRGEGILPACPARTRGEVMGRPETICPRANCFEPLVRKINRPRNTMSLD